MFIAKLTYNKNKMRRRMERNQLYRSRGISKVSFYWGFQFLSVNKQHNKEGLQANQRDNSVELARKLVTDKGIAPLSCKQSLPCRICHRCATNMWEISDRTWEKHGSSNVPAAVPCPEPRVARKEPSLFRIINNVLQLYKNANPSLPLPFTIQRKEIKYVRAKTKAIKPKWQGHTLFTATASKKANYNFALCNTRKSCLAGSNAGSVG